MRKPVIVWGPPERMTQNKDELARAFGCGSINDEWSEGQTLAPGTLHLTNVRPRGCDEDALIMYYANAMARARG